MGQYRQWLQYREIDQQLRTQLTTLEQELATLIERTRPLTETLPISGDQNLILKALMKRSSPNELLKPIPDTPPVERLALQAEPERAVRPGIGNATETVSPALFGWSQLPNFNAQQADAAALQDREPTSLPSTPMPEDLLPADLSLFIETHAQTPVASKSFGDFHSSFQQENSPFNQQGLRTNQLVQRWLERWGKQSQDI